MADASKDTFKDNPRCVCEHRKSCHDAPFNACELCACDDFTEVATEATYSDEQIRDAIKRVYNYDPATDFKTDDGMLATMLDQQQREIERLRTALNSAYKKLGPARFMNPNG